MAKLKVTLEPEWNKRTKKIDIFTNGQEIGSVYNGETREFEIPAGTYKVTAKTGWRGSKEYNLAIGDNETKAVNVALFKYGNSILTIFLLILVVHFIALVLFNVKYIVLFTIPFALILVYYLTFGKDDYLTIKEKE
jgi:hypothetical protein